MQEQLKSRKLNKERTKPNQECQENKEEPFPHLWGMDAKYAQDDDLHAS